MWKKNYTVFVFPSIIYNYFWFTESQQLLPVIFTEQEPGDSSSLMHSTCLYIFEIVLNTIIKLRSGCPTEGHPSKFISWKILKISRWLEVIPEGNQIHPIILTEIKHYHKGLMRFIFRTIFVPKQWKQRARQWLPTFTPQSSHCSEFAGFRHMYRFTGKRCVWRLLTTRNILISLSRPTEGTQPIIYFAFLVTVLCE